MLSNNFINRHNGPRQHQINEMLKSTGVSSLDELIDQTIPPTIRMDKALDLPEGMNEYEFLKHLEKLASKNHIFKS